MRFLNSGCSCWNAALRAGARAATLGHEVEARCRGRGSHDGVLSTSDATWLCAACCGLLFSPQKKTSLVI